MQTSTHRVLGAASVLALAHYGIGAHLPWPGVLLAAVVASRTAGGATSPDIDNQPKWKGADRLFPDEALGHGGLLGHRRLMHWIGLPAAAALGWVLLVPTVTWSLWAIAWGALTGWTSHIFPGDFVFGHEYPQKGIPRGIPLMPWWGHVGLGLRCGTWIETTTRYLLMIAIVILMAIMLGDIG